MNQLIAKANALSMKVHGVSYHEIYGFDVVEPLLIQKHISELEKKLKFFQPHMKNVETSSKFMTYWTEYWNSVVVHQPILCKLYGLAAIAQTLKHVRMLKTGGTEDDIRIHICNIMPNGTGKSEANDSLSKYAKMLGMVYTSVERYNDAVLVGSINKSIAEMNFKNNKREGDPGYHDPEYKGILRSSDFVVFDEGENILKTAKDTEGAQRLLQKSMNRIGSESNCITNDIIGYTVSGHPSCSVIITSYYLDEFEETLLERGLLQRMIVYYQEEIYDKRTSIIDTLIDGIPVHKTGYSENEEIEYRRSRHAQLLNNIKEEAIKIRDFHKDTDVVTIMPSAKTIIRDGVNELRSLMPFMQSQKNVWESMISRMVINMLKVASVHALTNYRTYIDDVDAMYSANLMVTTMHSLANFLRANVKTKQNYRAIDLYKLLSKMHLAEELTVEQWVGIGIDEYSLDAKSASNLIMNLIDTNHLKLKIRGKERRYVIE